MIAIYKTIDDKLTEIRAVEKGCWINIIDPTALDNVKIQEISEQYEIPIDFFTDPLDLDERARYDYEEQHHFVIMRVPYYDEENLDVPFNTLPLGVIINPDFIATICLRRTKIIDDFTKGREKHYSTQKALPLLLRILLKLTILYLNDLKEIYRRSDRIEKELHESVKNEIIVKLLNLEKSLVYFSTSIKSNEALMERLIRSRLIKPDSDERDELDDIIIDNKQALEMSRIYSDILNGMMEAFASIISNNLNITMKYLTSISIILMIPTLIASMYGMNVRLPFQNSHYAFLFIIFLSVFLSGMSIYLFVKRNFF